MNNKRATKRALLTSIMALVMCVVMLVGTTFAWFTDTASTGVNKIQAGNLDIKVEYRTSFEGDWKTLDDATDLFGAAGTLFEPGHTRVVELRITNAGNLALKYKIGMNVVSEQPGTNKAGNPYKLSNYLKVATTLIQSGPTGDYLTDQVAAAMESLIFQRDASYIWTARDFANFELEIAGNGNVHSLQPGEMQFLGIKVYMPESVGNEANAISTKKAASIEFGLNILATQYTTESDSFGTQYDKDALYPDVTVIKAEGEKSASDVLEDVLSGVGENNKEVINVALSEDTTFAVKPYDQKPMGGDKTKVITINGQGHKLIFNNTNNDWNNVTWGDAKLVIKNAVIDNSGHNADGGTWNSHDITFKGNVELENVTFTNAVAIEGTAVLKNVKISDKNATQQAYMLWIRAGSTVTLDNCIIDGTSDVTGIKNCAIAIKDQYLTAPGMTKLTINGGTISSNEKAAVLVTSAGGADITMTSVNISGTQDTTNAVWYDGAGDNITVRGCSKTARSH